MSLESLALAIAARGLSPSSKLVLILLANRGLDDGRHLTLAVLTELAQENDIDVETVCRSIDELRSHGYLS